ncbi:hypothetical protein A5630_07530 [Mycolicibacterium mucogenicum]|uniref:Uncharacterized protein n=1 Tax=Mycolicibacterium mucogenicum TaxID=56689 RepID=A0A1A3GK94_MYCMU|nr:hypothetical protein A5630_07530 [Mycolicibacterium mucogenicum]
MRVNWPTIPPRVVCRFGDELLPVVEPVVDDPVVVVAPVVDDPVVVVAPVVLPPVVVDVSEPVVVPPVVVPVEDPVVLEVPAVEPPEVPVLELPVSVSANATTASGPNANNPAVTRLEAARSRAWGITRRSPPLF